MTSDFQRYEQFAPDDTSRDRAHIDLHRNIEERIDFLEGDAGDLRERLDALEAKAGQKELAEALPEIESLRARLKFAAWCLDFVRKTAGHTEPMCRFLAAACQALSLGGSLEFETTGYAAWDLALTVAAKDAGVTLRHRKASEE